MQTHSCTVQTHTHTLTFQTEHGSSLISTFIHKKEISASSSILPFHSFLNFLFLALLSSPPLHCSVKAFTHRHTDPDTYTPLSRCLSRHLPPSLSPLTHMHTLWVATSQLLHRRKLLCDPPASPLSLPASLNVSPPPLVLRGIELEAQPGSNTLEAADTKVNTQSCNVYYIYTHTYIYIRIVYQLI